MMSDIPSKHVELILKNCGIINSITKLHLVGYCYWVILRCTDPWILKKKLFNPLNAELNPICHLLALLGAHHIHYVSRIRVNGYPYSNMPPGITDKRGTGWRGWLRHWATSRRVAGSIPDGVIGIFHWHNPSGRTIALGLTQPLTEMSTRNISWG